MIPENAVIQRGKKETGGEEEGFRMSDRKGILTNH